MEHEDWRFRTQAWLAEAFGLGVVEVSLETTQAALYPLPAGMLVIVSGRTARHPTRLHAVLARTLPGGAQWEYLHDPHPDDIFLTVATHLMWLAPLDPAKVIK